MDQNLFYCVVCVIFQYSMCKYAVMKHEHVFCKHLTNILFFCLCSDSKYISNKSAKAKLFVIPSLYSLPLYLTNEIEESTFYYCANLKKKKQLHVLVEFCNLIYEMSVQVCVFGKIYPSYRKTSLQVTMADGGIRIFTNFCKYQIMYGGR